MSTTNATGAAALVPLAPAASVGSPISSADDLAAAFLLGYGEATRAAYGRDLRTWARWLRGLGVAPLDAHRAHVEMWSRAMEGDGRAPSTIARRLAALSGFYESAVDEGLSRGPPLRASGDRACRTRARGSALTATRSARSSRRRRRPGRAITRSSSSSP
jgi:Phage integrase, N-terminal SAM-like domain